MSTVKKLYQFSASVKLAVPLLILLTLAMIAGTILESKYSSDIAQDYIYYNPLFILLNALIAINILLATITRYPFKRAQTGFVITHIGLILIFLGAIGTQLFGIDGSLVLQEGKRSNVLHLRRAETNFYLPFVVKLKNFELKKEAMTKAMANFESVVEIAKNEYTINMNNPLEMDGFYLYQSSYQLDARNGHVSIFSVAYDPGRSLKYIGSLMLFLGMGIMYWFKTGIFSIGKKVLRESEQAVA